MPDEFDNNQVDDQVEDQNQETSGEDDVLEAIRQINAYDENETDDDEEEFEEEDPSDDTENEEEEDFSEEEDDFEDDQNSDDIEDPQPQRGGKNAEMAARRREQELQERVQAEIERLREEAPEFRLARQLSEQTGQTPEAIIEQMKEEALKAEAQQRNVPVELLRERQQYMDNQKRLEEELNQLKYQTWQNSIMADSSRVKSEYTMLDDKDIDVAVDYILNVAKNVNVPLEQAIFAVHGKKIIDGFKKNSEQEVLAKEAGRKKRSLPPQGGKPSPVASLTDDEKYVARQMGMSEEEYLKYK
jgi:hypothetical protein